MGEDEEKKVKVSIYNEAEIFNHLNDFGAILVPTFFISARSNIR